MQRFIRWNWSGIRATKQLTGWEIIRKCSSKVALLDAFKNKAVQNSRCSIKELNEILNNKASIVESSGFLLECIAKYLPDVPHSEKSILISNIWEVINKAGNVTETDYIKLFRAKTAINDSVNIAELLSNVDNINPSPLFYEEMLYMVGTSQSKDDSMILDILAHMKEKRFNVTERMFNALIVAHSRRKSLENVQTVLDTYLMNEGNTEPSPDTKFELVRAHLENDSLDKADALITETVFSTEQLIEVVKCIIEQNCPNDLLSKVMRKFPEEVTYHKEISPVIRNLLLELIHVKKTPRKITEIIEFLPKPVVQAVESLDSYGSVLISELFQAKSSLEDIIHLCSFLHQSGRNPRALFIATEVALRLSSNYNLELLKEVAKHEPLKPHYFWKLIIDNFTKNGEQGIIETIKEMKSLSVELDHDTFSIYVFPRLPIILKDIRQGLNIITDAGVKMGELNGPLLPLLLGQGRYNEFLYVYDTYPTKFDSAALSIPLIRGLRIPGAVKKAMKIIKKMSEKPDHLNFPGQILLDLINGHKTDLAMNLVNEYVTGNVRISKSVSDAILDRLKEESKFTAQQMKHLEESMKRITSKLITSNIENSSLTDVKHPREMNLEELECHLVELETKKMNARGVLRRMLQLSVRENKLKLAQELKEKCDSLKVDSSPGMLASCFDLYTKTKNLTEAKAVWNDLAIKFPGFLVDEHKVIDYATLLINFGQPGEARKALKIRARSKIIGLNNNKNVWNLLTAQANKSKSVTENETKLLLDLLVKLRYCSYDNAVLGPIIREWLIKGNLLKAVETFQEFVRDYKKTPLNLELMTALVEIKNGENTKFPLVDQDKATELLQNLLCGMEEIHGKSAAQTSLLFAMAEGGTENQVRKLLIDSNVRIDSGVFQKQCEYLCHSGKMEPLLKLAKSGRGLGHKMIDEQNMYAMLMDSFSRENNFEAGMKLFERMIEEDVKVPTELGNRLVELLQRNNLEIPKRLASYSR